MKAAIIGCGYVGTAVAQHWQTQGVDVLATTTRAERVQELKTVADRVEILRGTDAEHLQAALADRQVVLLCVGSKRGANYADTYLSTAQTLARILPNVAVEQLIYTSTYSVYGQHHGAWVTEEMPVAPVTENGKIIAATEQTLLETTTPHRQVCILRLGGIYGPGRTLEKIYSRATGTTRSGTGNEGSNWIHLEDIVGTIDWVRQHRLSGFYNLVQDEILTVRELIGAVCERYNLEPICWDETKPSDRPYNVRVSNAKLKRTGYQFNHSTFWPMPSR
ncbi:MAG: NAD-dependent epimerase/dehydratase family protein [Leptolyngbya sp. SIO1D8]|nr:NAD-dependent epimerase/dehydratase family protein [Leptolyngbya sp. SIO1D8]